MDPAEYNYEVHVRLTFHAFHCFKKPDVLSSFLSSSLEAYLYTAYPTSPATAAPAAPAANAIAAVSPSDDPSALFLAFERQIKFH